MKTLNDYMAMSYRMEIVEDKDEGGFVNFYPDLPGCITCGETVESAVSNALDAKNRIPGSFLMYSRNLFVLDFARRFFVSCAQIFEAYAVRTLIKFGCS